MKILNSETKSAQHTAYGFFVFSSMAESCILPYITLFFKHLGLSATHAGILTSIQSFLSIWTLIFWVHFATRFNAYRLIIVSSLIVSIIGFLCVTLLSPLETSVYLINCPYTSTIRSKIVVNSTEDHFSVTTHREIEENGEFVTKMAVFNGGAHEVTPVEEKSDFYYNSYDKYGSNERNDDGSNYISDSRPNFDASKNRYDETELLQPDYENANAYYDESEDNKISKRSFLNSIWAAINPEKTSTQSSTSTSRSWTMTDDVTLSTEPEIYAFIDYASKNYDKIEIFEENHENRGSNRLSYLLIFITFILGWIFGSPATTVADQAWYGFLDDLDLTEKYGNHRACCLIMAGVASLGTSLSVAATNCRLWLDVDHFNIHFYSYAFFATYALLFAFCFPIVSSKFSLALPQTTKMSEYKLLFSDLSLFLVTLTAVLAGIFNSIVDNFLIWTIEDLGGSEVHFGILISLGFLMEIFAANTSRCLLRRLKLHPVLIICLIFFSFRLLFFSFMWNPWIAIIGQFIHFFSAALLPAILNAYLSRTCDHGAFRAIRTVVVPCLELFGRTIGSCVFGLGFDAIGASFSFQVAAGFGFLWSFVLLIVYKVKLGNSKRYLKLIHVQEIDGTTGDSETDEDWLDDAGKKVDISPTSA